MSYRGMLTAEWRKVTTTKMLWILALSSVAFSVLNVLALVLIAPSQLAATPGVGSRDLLLDPDYLTTVIASAGSASIFVLILGIVGMTGEYRHMTITSTFLASPRRGRVLAAKAVTYAVFGAAIAVVNLVVVVGVVAAALIGRDHAPLTGEAVLSVLIGAVIGLALYALLGISLGGLIRSQVVAIVVAVVWVMLIEALVSALLPSVGKWLPGGALNAAMNVSLGGDLSPANLLAPWAGALVLLGYAVVLGVVASFTTLRRDIT